jgi:kynurenine 3-monooxygenase
MEDVLKLDAILDQQHENWGAAFQAYESSRKKDTDAIADLAVENYYEMRDHVDNPDFIAKRAIEMQLEKNYPDYASKYNLVTFCEHVPYSIAKDKGKLQDKWLLKYCNRNNISGMTTEELDRVYKELMDL